MKTDLELQKVVMEELQWQPTLKPSKIGVSVSNGVVTLSGMVDNYGQKRDAENAVLGVEGIKAIADDLEVSLHQENVRTDTEIAEAAINTLTWHSLVPKDKMRKKSPAMLRELRKLITNWRLKSRIIYPEDAVLSYKKTVWINSAPFSFYGFSDGFAENCCLRFRGPKPGIENHTDVTQERASLFGNRQAKWFHNHKFICNRI